MLKFNSEEQRAIMQHYRHLQKQLEGNTISAENVAMELLAFFPNVEYSKLLSDCQQMDAGIQRFMDAYGDPSSEEPADVNRILDRITNGMNEQQSKGFYLNVYNSLREYDSQNYAEAAESQQACELVQHVVDEDSLRDLVVEQTEMKGEELALDCMGDDMSDEEYQEKAPEPMLYAAAIYAASLDGSIPGHFAKSPEMTGACAAAASTLAQQVNDNPEKAKDKAWVGKVIAGVCVTALLVGMAIVAAPTVVATVQHMVTSLSMSNVTMLIKNNLRPVLRTARYWAPGLVIGAEKAITKAARAVGQKIRSFYHAVKSRLQAGKDETKKKAELPESTVEAERDEEENLEEEEAEEEEAYSDN